MNDNIEKQPPVPPFVRFVASAVPMVFDNSLSYYEAICAMWKYLSDTVDVINNNATVTEEYIQLTKDMKEYMDNYFDNLDVQEEINNKLDAMVEAGTLQEIITSYIQANVAWTFDTVADMKASENLINGSYARTLGFRSLNDGGGATYYITDSGTANEMDIIAIDTLRAHLVIPSEVTPEMFGAYGDGSHDDTVYLKRVFAVAKNIKFGKDYIISDKIDILEDTVLDGNYHTVTNNTAINCFRANSQNNITIKNLNIIGDNTVSEAQIGLNFINSDNIHIENVDIEHTGGDGIAFGTCTNCSVKNAKLTDNLISIIAYNCVHINCDNINVDHPRFQYGIQYKSCQYSNMSNVFVDTPRDCGVYVSKGNEEGSRDTYDITLSNITVLNEAQNGDNGGNTLYSIVLANGVNHRLINSYIYNAVNGGILLNSSNSSVVNTEVKGCDVGITSKGDNNTITNCYIDTCTTYGIRLEAVNNNKLCNSTIKNSGKSSSTANLELDTTTNATIQGNTFEIPNAGTQKINILVKTSISGANISNNTFINPNTSNSYFDYGNTYDFDTSVFKNNGVVRLHNFQSVTLFPGVIEWDKGGIIVKPTGTVTSTPSYSGFRDGSIMLKTDYTDYYGYICKSGTWYPFGAIVS